MKKKFLILWLLSLSVVFPRPWEKFFNNEKVDIKVTPLEFFDLDNGVRVYYKKNNIIPRINVQLIFNGGECEESSEKTGLTDIWGKSVVYSGSKEFPREKFSRIFESHGSELSFSSSLERTIYSFQALSEYFPDDLKLALNVITNPRFEKEDVDLLKAQIIQGIKKIPENAGQRAYLASHLILWKNNPRGTMATIASISKIRNEDLLNWQKKIITQKRLSILVTGDFETEALKKILQPQISKLPDMGNKLDTSILKVNDLNERKGDGIIYHQDMSVPQTTILFAAPGITHNDPDYYALKLFDFLLGGNSFNSYLTQVIRVKNGWAYGIYSSYQSNAFTGSLSVFTQTQNPNVASVVFEIEKILNDPGVFINESNLQEAKNSLNNRFVFFAETPEKMAALQLSLIWDNLDDNYLQNFLQNINKVSVDDIKRVAKKYYNPDNFFISIVGPDSVLNDIRKNQSQKKIVEYKLPE